MAKTSFKNRWFLGGLVVGERIFFGYLDKKEINLVFEHFRC
jgi:hypothetical protein